MAAIVFLKSLVIRQIIPLDEKMIELVKDACQDKLLSVRRNAIRAFTQLVIRLNPMDRTASLNVSTTATQKMTLHLEWLHMILDKMDDGDKTVKEEAVNMVFEHLIDPIVTYSNHQMWDALHDYPHQFHEVLQRNLKSLFSQLIRDGKLPHPEKLVKNIWHQFQMHDGNFEVGWILLKVLYSQNKSPRLIEHEKMSQYFLDNARLFVLNYPIVAHHAIELMADMLPDMHQDIRVGILEESRALLVGITADKIELCAPIAKLIRTDETSESTDWIFTRFRLADLEKNINKMVQTNSVDAGK